MKLWKDSVYVGHSVDPIHFNETLKHTEARPSISKINDHFSNKFSYCDFDNHYKGYSLLLLETLLLTEISNPL